MIANRRRRKILHVTADAEMGGAQVYLAELAREQRRRGDEVTILTGGQGLLMDLYRENATRFIQSSSLRRGIGPADALAPVAVARTARDHDVLHAHTSKGLTASALSLSLHDLPLVWTAHGYDSAHADFRSSVRPALDAFKRWLVRRCDAVSAASHSVERKIIAAGLPPERVRVIYTGVRADRFGSVPAPENKTITIGSAGRFVPLKGYTHLIDAAAIVVKRATRPVHFVVFGTGPEEQALRDRIKYQGLTDVFELRPFTDDVPGAFADMDVFVVPSVVDSFPLVLCEALVAGRPIIATTVGGLPDAFAEGRHGYFVPPADPSALAEAIERFLVDPTLAGRMGAAAHAYATKRYRWETVADEYDELYALADSR